MTRGAVAGRSVGEDLRQPVEQWRARRAAPGQFRPEDVDTSLEESAHIAEVRLVLLGRAPQGPQLRQAQCVQVRLAVLRRQHLPRLPVRGSLPGPGLLRHPSPARSGCAHGLCPLIPIAR